MKYRFFVGHLILIFLTITVLAFAHEMTGWIAPEEARQMKNPVKATKESIQKGKEIYEKKCAPCHGIKGDGKGPNSAGLNPKPANFRDPHGERMTDGEHFWKITTGRGAMPSFAKDLTERERWDVISCINTFSKHA